MPPERLLEVRVLPAPYGERLSCGAASRAGMNFTKAHGEDRLSSRG